MDWKIDVATNLWILPRGMARNGQAGPNSVTWTSKYGSVIATGYEVSTTDGMNEAGLVANLLWLVESEYPTYDGRGPGLSIAAWAQYMLDNYGTVNEAVEALRTQPFTVVTDKVPGEDRLATLRLSMSDASGDSAIIEYIAGKQVIHHSRDYQVMTNSPVFDQQLALNTYWKQIGGTVMLPGTNRAADRFARASFYVNAIPKSEDPVKALASVFSVIRNASVPFGINTPEEPNISSTRWRTVADHKRRLYFLRVCADAEHVLGGPEGHRLLEGDRQGAAAGPGPRPAQRVRRQHREGLPTGGTVRVPGPVATGRRPAGRARWPRAPRAGTAHCRCRRWSAPPARAGRGRRPGRSS